MVDVHESREYPIVLGDSLKSGSAKSKYLQFRYNWAPKSGFQGSSGILKKSADDFSLSYELDGDDYNYAGWSAGDQQDDETSELVLVYDKGSNNFRLEKLAASIDLNLKSASNAFASDIRKYQQIPKQSAVGASTDEDDSAADPSNPFDYRHFLANAQQELDKSSHPAGNRTPLPGARTPLSGLASPAPGATQFKATTPEFKPADTVPQKRRGAASKRKTATTARRQPAPKAGAGARGKVLSKDRISDSDEDINLGDGSPPRRVTHPSSSKPKKAAAHSPQIHVSSASDHEAHRTSDAESDGGLEIDMGTPPPSSKAKRHINVEAFRSNANTPRFGRGLDANRMDDVDMMDAEEDANQDVESLDLEKEPPSPAPPAHQSTFDEDDVDLEAEFEKELEAEDEDAGVGLGIDHGHAGGRDYESEISEEE